MAYSLQHAVAIAGVRSIRHHSNQREGDWREAGRFKFQRGELVLADAGYSNPPGIAAVVDAGADVCVRMNQASLPLLDEKDRPFLLLKKLKTLRKAGETAEWRVFVPSGEQRIAGRICSIRKSEEAIGRAQRRLVRNERRVTPENWEYACYVVVFTTLPKRKASTGQVLECYRLRWQIELVFKRLKSLVQLGHVPKQDDQSSRAWLYGKLFVALLSQKLTRIGRAVSPGATICQTKAPIRSPWREFRFAFHWVTEAIAPSIGLATMASWNEIAAALGERNRKRKPQWSKLGPKS